MAFNHSPNYAAELKQKCLDCDNCGGSDTQYAKSALGKDTWAASVPTPLPVILAYPNVNPYQLHLRQNMIALTPSIARLHPVASFDYHWRAPVFMFADKSALVCA
jgi:hypothetical protein